MELLQSCSRVTTVLLYRFVINNPVLLANVPRQPFKSNDIGPVRLAQPQLVNSSPTYLRNGLSVLTAKVTVEWNNNFQNELTNQKFDSNSTLNLTYWLKYNVEPITRVDFQVLKNAKQFWSLKRPHHYGIFMSCHHATDRARRWHLVVTCDITVGIVKTIVIVAYLPYQVTQIILGLWNINEWWRWPRSHTLARFGRNFVCHVTCLPISRQEMPRFELSYRSNLQQPAEFKIVRTEK